MQIGWYVKLSDCYEIGKIAFQNVKFVCLDPQVINTFAYASHYTVLGVMYIFISGRAIYM